MKITICCSASFFKDAEIIAQKLEGMGFGVLLPYSKKEMGIINASGVNATKTWLNGRANFDKKTKLIEKHILAVESGDAILVVNNSKHGISGYIGGNTLIEMAIAFYLNKPIYLLNDFPNKDFMLYEEIVALHPLVINGNLSKVA